jgi:hypothetical protein
MIGMRVVITLLVPRDYCDGVGLDDQVLGQPSSLVGRCLGGRLVGITDRDQVSHDFLSFSLGRQVMPSASARPLPRSTRDG